MRIEAPVLDFVPGVRPRPGRAVQDDGIREREVEQQQASRLGLARGNEERGDQADDRAGGRQSIHRDSNSNRGQRGFTEGGAARIGTRSSRPPADLPETSPDRR